MTVRGAARTVGPSEGGGAPTIGLLEVELEIGRGGHIDDPGADREAELDVGTEGELCEGLADEVPEGLFTEFPAFT